MTASSGVCGFRDLVIVLVVAGCSGCYSQFPLDSAPRTKVDMRLLGIWRCVPADADSSESAVVTVKEAIGSDRQYEIAWQEGDKEAERYRAFGSILGNSTFLNIGDAEGHKAAEAADDNQKEGWAFARYSMLRPNIMHVELVPERVFAEKGSSKSVAVVRATLERALRESPPGIEDMSVCVRKGK